MPSQGSSSTLDQRNANPSATWWQALTLTERGHIQDPGDVEDEVAARRYQRWLDEASYLDPETVATYLTGTGITPDELKALLVEQPSILQTRCQDPLPWLDDLRTVYSTPAEALPLHFGPEAGFLAFTAPLIAWGMDQLLARLSNIGEVIFSRDFARQTLVNTLAEQLPPLIERTMVLEMHVARLQGILTGETPAERFAAYVAHIANPATALTILEEYPVLARQLVTKVRFTVNLIAEILERLTDDWAQLTDTLFDGSDPGALVELEIGAGDTHREGRSVAILRFTSGQRLVYKPRSLAVDQQFQSLLTWLNQQGATPPYRTLTILARVDYGWVEFVAAAPCTTVAELERFYQRQGGYLAILYALNAADFHFENLIAAGEHPLLIDLEALFHPETMAYDPNNPGQLAQQALDNSVLSIGMLPQRLRFHADAQAIDVSGLGAEETQLTPDKLPVWQGAGTDEMRLTRQHIEFRSEGHRARVDGQTLDAEAQGAAVAAGFTQMYRLILDNRSELLAPEGPLARFDKVEIRVVARATRTYSLLLQESSHPDLLRDALDRDRFYTRLWQDLAAAPQLQALLAAEWADLHQGDVPIFLTTPTARDLWDSRGERIPDYLAESGMNRVRTRIIAMDARDLARQLWYIHASFATLSGGNQHTTATAQTDSRSAAAASTDNLDFVDAARAIGDHLAELAHRHGEHAVWIGLGLDEHESWALSPLTMHLYDGHAGLALFYAYLGAATGEERYRSLAEAALATTLAQAEPLASTFSYLGAFNGWGGLIYTLTHLGKLWQRPALWKKASEFAAVAAGHVERDEHFDIIGGAAGCIGAVATLYRCTADPQLLSLIKQCADHLVAHAQPQPNGVGWVVPNMGGQALAGFSHGAAGIAWSLLTAAELTGNAHYQQIAQEALRYERSLFAPDANNWRDLRAADDAEPSGEDSHMHAWCHGAPGIGLARLAMSSQLDDPMFQNEIDAALTSTAAAGFGGGHSLCHGDLGNLELFVKAAESLNRPDLLTWANQRVAAILSQQQKTGWICGVPGGVETPGLMVGLAGIGYELLRLADPAAVPSVLLLEAPA